jgi:hypothetical protein
LRALSAIALMLLAAVSTTGCRDEEQGRKLNFDKGKYAGPAVPAASSEAQKGWQDRTQRLWKQGS